MMAECQLRPGMVPGKFARMWRDWRYVDVTVVLAAPGSMKKEVEEERLEPLHKKPRLKEEDSGEGSISEREWVGVTKCLLAGNSEYFRKRLEDWEADRWTTTGAEGLPVVVVVGVDQDLQPAAKAVLQLMYEEVVPGGLPAVELAKVEPSSVDAEDLSTICSLLPDSLNQLPQYKAWQEQCQRIIAGIIASYTDVHALVTSAAQLQQFGNLPFMVIKAWAASDDLVVDSEDSVAVALDWWIRCSHDGCHDGPMELAKLVRMKHVSPDRRLHWLQGRSWADHSLADQLAVLNVGLAGGINDFTRLPMPEAWLAPARKQSREPVVVAWDVPFADLKDLLGGQSTTLSSPAAYVSGTGVQMQLKVDTDSSSNKTEFVVSLRLASYTPPGLDTPLCDAGAALVCNYTLTTQLPSRRVPRVLISSTHVLSRKGLGAAAASTADLGKLCVGGLLRLMATIIVKSSQSTRGPQ